MPRYEAYKNSGAAWLGEIPYEWKTGVIGSLYTLRNTKVNDTDYPPLSVTMKGIVPQLETAAKTDAHDARKLVLKGDFAINSRSDRRGSCGISDYDGSVSLINTVLTPRGEMHPQYYNWLFHTVQFADEYYKNGHGIVDDLWTTRWNEMKRISIPVPSLTEQEGIADYLKKKISHIDSVIAEAKASIEEYKAWKASIIYETVTKGLDPDAEMKDSGVEWIGNIPAHWSVQRGKNVLTLLERPVKANDEVITCFRDGEVTLRKKRREEGFTVSLQEVGYQGIEPGDLVVHGMDGFAGAIGVSDSRGKGTPVLNVLDSPHNKYFLMYYLRAAAIKDVFMSLSTGIRVRSCDLRWNKLSVFPFVLPTGAEQEEIVDYLNCKCKRITELINEKEELINELEAFKKSLVFEVVTGKRRVY